MRVYCNSSKCSEDIENKHVGIRYPCSQCEYIAPTVSDLNRHVKNKHEGVRYPCSECEYAATRTHNLNKHIKIMHKC